MTVYLPRYSRFPFWPANHQMETGSSAKLTIATNVGRVMQHYLMPRLEQLLCPIQDVFANSQSEEVPVAIETAAAAVTFARLLPRMVPIPEVSSDPDGEIAFDWSAPSGNLFLSA